MSVVMMRDKIPQLRGTPTDPAADADDAPVVPEAASLGNYQGEDEIVDVPESVVEFGDGYDDAYDDDTFLDLDDDDEYYDDDDEYYDEGEDEWDEEEEVEEVEVETVPESTPEMEAEAVPETVPETVPESEIEAVAAPEGALEAEPELEAALVAEPNAEPEAVPESTPEAVPETTPEVASEAAPQEGEGELDVETEPEEQEGVTEEAIATTSEAAESTEQTPESFGFTINPASLALPERRYLAWSELKETERQVAEISLGYSEDTWNKPGSNHKEGSRFDDLEEDEKGGVIMFGLNEEKWDCHINHYLAYWWEDMEELGFDQYLIALGWQQDNWDDEDLPPAETEDLYWEKLTPKQQAAARQLCWFEEVWDGASILDFETKP
eukprot:CAMPEP_0183786878 /NCGR_PEP_ID=MMETSP0739-20130205/67254_1 /TAXON_ID=385413 /ORGANISM="Thalassiosira miniscula, Strain CCMP1093" /LENGTH=381 /DNA_ID=CAMNT_0026030943 /DNA_START=201 /DNA_END=1346 /DNA_ORIENTATION=-